MEPENYQAYNQLLYYKPGQVSNVLIDILTQEVEPRGAEGRPCSVGDDGQEIPELAEPGPEQIQPSSSTASAAWPR